MSIEKIREMGWQLVDLYAEDNALDDCARIMAILNDDFWFFYLGA